MSVTQAAPLIELDWRKAERQLQRERLRAIRKAEAAKRIPDGTLHIMGVPPMFPPFIAAVSHLPSAKKLNKERIRIDHGGRTWERTVEWIEREATRLWLLRNKTADTLSLSRSHEPKLDLWPGAVFSAQGDTSHG
jgi:hypothetical protein